MSQLRSWFGLLLVADVMGCTATEQQPPGAAANATADREAIDRGHEAFVAGMRASDCNALLPLLTDDVVFSPPNAPDALGLDAVRAWCEPIFTQMKTSSVTISNRDVTVAGDWAIEHGNYDWAMTPAAGGAEVREQGRFVAVYHRLPDGSWKLNRDIWNSSLPLPTR